MTHWRLPFLIVTRWRLGHCWVNTSMPLTNNPRWLGMLLSRQNGRWDRKSLWAECDTSSLVFEQGCTALNVVKCWFYYCFWEHVVFLTMFALRMNSYQVIVNVNEEHVRFVSSCNLYNMPNYQTWYICLLWSFCRFCQFAFWEQGWYGLDVCLLKSKWCMFIYCRSVLKHSLLKVESLNLSHDPPSDSISVIKCNLNMLDTFNAEENGLKFNSTFNFTSLQKILSWF